MKGARVEGDVGIFFDHEDQEGNGAKNVKEIVNRETERVQTPVFLGVWFGVRVVDDICHAVNIYQPFESCTKEALVSLSDLGLFFVQN